MQQHPFKIVCLNYNMLMTGDGIGEKMVVFKVK